MYGKEIIKAANYSVGAGRIKTDYYQFEGPRPPKNL